MFLNFCLISASCFLYTFFLLKKGVSYLVGRGLIVFAPLSLLINAEEIAHYLALIKAISTVKWLILNFLSSHIFKFLWNVSVKKFNNPWMFKEIPTISSYQEKRNCKLRKKLYHKNLCGAPLWLRDVRTT